MMGRTVKRPDERRQEIIGIAKALFLENEYERTTMQDIVTGLGIAKGTVYHYFGSKDELLDGVVEDMVSEHVVRLKAIADGAEGNALDRIRIVLGAANVSEAQSDTVEKLHRAGNVALHTRQLAVFFEKMAPLLAELIEQGCREGLFETDHPLEVAELFLTGIQFLTDVGVYPWKEGDLLRRSKAIPVLVEAQLKAPKGSFAFLAPPSEGSD